MKPITGKHKLQVCLGGLQMTGLGGVKLLHDTGNVIGSTTPSQPNNSQVWPGTAFIHCADAGVTANASEGSIAMKKQNARKQIGVVKLLPSRGHSVSFSLRVPPLHVEPSSACSVASLSQFPGL